LYCNFILLQGRIVSLTFSNTVGTCLRFKGRPRQFYRLETTRNNGSIQQAWLLVFAFQDAGHYGGTGHVSLHDGCKHHVSEHAGIDVP
jgi:hypothetical protein